MNADAEKAFEAWLDTHPRKGRGAEWLAACAWQRERDAQIIETCPELNARGRYVAGGLGYLAADIIRKQDAK